MDFSWFMHLFIFILFSLFLSSKADIFGDKYDEDVDHLLSTTKNSLILPGEEVESHGEYGVATKTTTSAKKTTKHHMHPYHGEVEYYTDESEDEDEDETEDEKVSPTTLITTILSSSSSKIRLTTHAITETTTNKNEIPLIRFTGSLSTWLYDIDHRFLSTTTMDPKQIAAYLTRTNRDRLLLKIFTIVVVIGMFSLAVAFITIHMVRKTKRYRGYRLPANTSSNEQSKHFINI